MTPFEEQVAAALLPEKEDLNRLIWSALGPWPTEDEFSAARAVLVVGLKDHAAPRVAAAIEAGARECQYLSGKTPQEREQIWTGTHRAALDALVWPQDDGRVHFAINSPTDLACGGPKPAPYTGTQEVHTTAKASEVTCGACLDSERFHRHAQGLKANAYAMLGQVADPVEWVRLFKSLGSHV